MDNTSPTTKPNASQSHDSPSSSLLHDMFTCEKKQDAPVYLSLNCDVYNGGTILPQQKHTQQKHIIKYPPPSSSPGIGFDSLLRR